MELFNELKNKSLESLIDIINNYVQAPVPIRKSYLENLLRNNTMLTNDEKNLIEALFTVNQKDNLLVPTINSPIPVQPTTVELEWLAEVLNDKRLNGILSNELRKKLQKAILTQPLPQNSIRQISWNKELDKTDACFSSEQYISLFQTAIKALEAHQYIYYESHDIYGRQYSGEAIPYKIEYCADTNDFNFIMWNEIKNWTFKSNFKTITKLEILPKVFSEDIIVRADKYVEKMKTSSEKIVLKIKSNDRNVLERCFYMFAYFDKEISKTDNGFKFELSHRDHFDKEEIEQYILSLGSGVTVIEPESLRSNIIEKINSSFNR